MIHSVQQEDTSGCHVESTCRMSNCRFFNFTLFFCYCCSFWVLRLPVDVSISPLLAMSYWDSSQWNSWDNQWQQQQQSPPPPPPSSNPPVSLPSHWRSTSQCWDDQVQYMVTVCTDQFNRLHGAARGTLLAKIHFPFRWVILPGMDLMKQRFERSVMADLLELFVQNLLLNLCLAPKIWRSRDRYRCYGWKPSSPVGPSAGHSQSHGQTDWVYGTFSSIHSR